MSIKQESIIICGKSGSGKDFLLRGLIKKKLKYQPKITTRPQRKLERQGIEYDFVDNDKFKILLESNEIKTYQYFLIEDPITKMVSDWYYAVSKQNFDESQLFIMTPHEIASLSPEDRSKCFIVYLDIPEDVRKSRITRRNDYNDSINRRMEADNVDFTGFTTYDLKITDSDFEIEMIYDLMLY